MISYNRLWKLLIDKGIKRTELKQLAGVSTNVIAKLGKNEPVVAYNQEYNCFTWISTWLSPECLSDITDAIAILKGGRGFAG